MTHESDRQQFLLPVSLVDDPVVSHSKLEEAGEDPSQGFRPNGVKVLGKPTKLLQYTIGHRFIKVFKILGGSRAKLDLVHLPFQAPSAGQFGRRNVLALLLRLIKVPAKAFPNLSSKNKTCVGVSQNFAQLILDYFTDERLQFLD